MGERTKACPKCGSKIPADTGYVSWCDNCNWGVKPHEVEDSASLFAQAFRRLGERAGRALLDEQLRARSGKPKFDAAWFAAMAISVLINLLSPAFAVGGVWLIVVTWPNVVGIAGGLLAIGIAIATRPHVPAKVTAYASREEFPTIYRVVDEIAEALGAPKPAGIIIDSDFNAWFGNFGIRWKGVVGIGAPLFAILTPQERVSTIAHELGHSINGDGTRSITISSAIRALTVWGELVRPETLINADLGLKGIATLPINLLLLGLSELIGLVVNLLALLLFRSHQRAEYHADYIETIVAGRDVAISALDKLHAGALFEFCVQRAATNPGGPDVFGWLRNEFARMPERERERLRRVARMEGSRLDDTHPPTRYRIAFLEKHGAIEPRYRMSAEDAAAFERELESTYEHFHKELIAKYQLGYFQ